jgi:hypothetical protein
MRVLIATDAWHPQVNGVVRTLTSLARSVESLGVNIEFLSPDGLPTLPLPTYSELRLALPGRSQIARRIDQSRPDGHPRNLRYTRGVVEGVQEGAIHDGLVAQ